MYRVEVATGEETVFRTIDELATGIRNGLITPRSRIFHAASQKWLPIEFHPHYKKALQQVTGGAPMLDLGPAAPSRPPRRSNPGAREPRPPEPPVPEPRISAPAPAPPAPVQPMRAEPPRVARVWPEPPRAYAPPAEAPPARMEPPRLEPPPPLAARVEAPRVELPRHDPVRAELPRTDTPKALPPASPEPLPVARRRSGHRGSFIIGVFALVALGGGSLATSMLPGGERARAEAPVQPDSPPQPAAEPEESPAAQEEPPPRALSPTVTAAEPGPRPTGPVSQAWSSSAGAIAPQTPPIRPAPAPVANAETPAIAPPPVELDLSLPQVPLADSLTGTGRPPRDSAAIRRILRAVTKSGAGSAQ